MANTSTRLPQTSPTPAPSDAVTNASTTPLRFTLQIVVIIALLGATFSGVSTYRDQLPSGAAQTLHVVHVLDERAALLPPEESTSARHRRQLEAEHASNVSTSASLVHCQAA